jgi:hypothetical protein
MRKLFLALLVILFTAGMASAAAVGGIGDATNSREIWITSVYNNTGSGATAVDAGDCLEWDIGSSTNDDKNWVVQCDAADTFLVAGVAWPTEIGAGSTGLMAIKGPVSVDTVDGSVEVGALMCSSATAGSVDGCSDTATDANALGFITQAGSGRTATMQVFVK